ncbi:N-acetyltransferase [Achlya hypogyna]|uniref:N-acetyltransferase n=1 Tax=Achlya hypogyna TaxID=1202772 RepID=A0A1V9YAT7_ACHHY|nr:N-acetyltransferase [Achlya hypogyna]
MTAASANLSPTDVALYLARVGLDAAAVAVHPPRSVGLLSLLCRHHAAAMPFENLASSRTFPVPASHVVYPGEVVSLAPEKVFRKLVLDRRGGYCFETNGLLATVLRTFGFPVDTIGGRVVLPNTDAAQPYWFLQALTHTLLLVTADDGADTQDYLCDVGFGGRGQPPCPMRLAAKLSRVDLPSGERYELSHVRSMRILASAAYGGALAVAKDALTTGEGDEWAVLYRTGQDKPMQPSYVFSTTTRMAQKDYEAANWYCSTSPMHHMTQRAVVARRHGSKLLTLNGLDFSVIDAGVIVESRTVDPTEVLDLLERRFDLVPSKTN